MKTEVETLVLLKHGHVPVNRHQVLTTTYQDELFDYITSLPNDFLLEYDYLTYDIISNRYTANTTKFHNDIIMRDLIDYYDRRN